VDGYVHYLTPPSFTSEQLYLFTKIHKHIGGEGKEKRNTRDSTQTGMGEIIIFSLATKSNEKDHISRKGRGHRKERELQQEPSVKLKPLNEKLQVHVDDELLLLNENEFKEYSKYEEQKEKISIEIELTPSDDNINLFDYDDSSDDEIYYNELHNTVHVQDEPMELQLYDD
jgi:hypothetical protein